MNFYNASRQILNIYKRYIFNLSSGESYVYTTGYLMVNKINIIFDDGILRKHMLRMNYSIVIEDSVLNFCDFYLNIYIMNLLIFYCVFHGKSTVFSLTKCVQSATRSCLSVRRKS